MIERLSAATLAVRDMGRSVRFYRALGFEIRTGGEDASFTSFAVGSGHLNLILRPSANVAWWGRLILYVSDVDALYRRAVGAGFAPATAPRDAEWGERYFHIADPDGHEISFAKPL